MTSAWTACFIRGLIKCGHSTPVIPSSLVRIICKERFSLHYLATPIFWTLFNEAPLCPHTPSLFFLRSSVAILLPNQVVSFQFSSWDTWPTSSRSQLTSLSCLEWLSEHSALCWGSSPAVAHSFPWLLIFPHQSTCESWTPQAQSSDLFFFLSLLPWPEP